MRGAIVFLGSLLATSFIVLIHRNSIAANKVVRQSRVVPSSQSVGKRELNSNPLINSSGWQKAKAINGHHLQRIQAPNGTFSLKFEPANEDTGDFERYFLIFEKNGQKIRIDQGFTAWAYITPDSRYVITEPLYLFDANKQVTVDLSKELAISNYVQIEGVALDYKRLLVSRINAAMEGMGDQKPEWFEISLP